MKWVFIVEYYSCTDVITGHLGLHFEYKNLIKQIVEIILKYRVNLCITIDLIYHYVDILYKQKNAMNDQVE